MTSRIVQGVLKLRAWVENSYKSRSPFIPLPLEDTDFSGLYTAIVHDGPLLRRIQDNWDELSKLKAHFKNVLFGWLATLHHLMLAVGYYALVCAALTLFG